ncbi:MAG: 16S rRNA (guanine(966)-N(2))-methyltransferase RsmD [Actinomycetaceae bacterium]|nr:16S rRNA (guanine(966)-N(2))-methyltransferase RsmD [Actinomycetaceae bacterium]
MTRIVAGEYRGRVLRVPDKGTRPTSERVREALFSRLESWDEIAGAAVLDLYAGSGALGLEALSRGARSCVLVDQARGAYRAVTDNISRNRIAGAKAVKSEALRFLNTTDGKFSLVFLDPPYDCDPTDFLAVLRALRSRVIPGALIVVEDSARSPQPQWPSGYICDSQRKWGETRVWFLTFSEEGGSVEA